MKASDILGLLIRVVGFLLCIYGLWYILYGLENIPSFFMASDDRHRSPFGDLAWGAPVLFFGLGCLFCADWIVNLSYRKPRDVPPPLSGEP